MSQRNSAPADFIQDFGSSFLLALAAFDLAFRSSDKKPCGTFTFIFKSSISSITSWGIRTVVIVTLHSSHLLPLLKLLMLGVFQYTQKKKKRLEVYFTLG
jgi:hypothetical protein